MAIPTSIKTLLSGDVVEWARIEFKETWDAAASLKSICAFANDLDNWGGGYIVIGVQEDNGRPVFPLKGVPQISWILIRKIYLQSANSLDRLTHRLLVLKHIKTSILLLYGVLVEITDRIHHQRQWKKIIKREYIIFVKLPIL